MLALVSARPGPLLPRPGRLARATASDAAPEDCEHYLAALLELGLLQVPAARHRASTPRTRCGLPRRPGRARPAVVAATGARRWTEPIALPGRLRRRRTPQRRRTLLGELRRGLGTAMESARCARRRVLPSTLLYEDVRCGDRAAALRRGALAEPAGADRCASLERVLPAFDQTLRHKQTLRGFFLARFGPGGRCEDLLSLVHDFHEDIYDEYQSYAARTPASTTTAGWSATRTGWPAPDDRRPRLGSGDCSPTGWAASPTASPEAAEVELDEDLRRRRRRRARQRRAPGSPRRRTSCRRAGDLVVHNSAYGGVAFPFSRFTHWYDQTELGRGTGSQERARGLAGSASRARCWPR